MSDARNPACTGVVHGAWCPCAWRTERCTPLEREYLDALKAKLRASVALARLRDERVRGRHNDAQVKDATRVSWDAQDALDLAGNRLRKAYEEE